MPVSSGVMNPEGVLLRRQEVEITHLVTFHRQNGCLTLARVQTPLPSGKIGEGALWRFFLRGGGSLHRLFNIDIREFKPGRF